MSDKLFCYAFGQQSIKHHIVYFSLKGWHWLQTRAAEGGRLQTARAIATGALQELVRVENLYNCPASRESEFSSPIVQPTVHPPYSALPRLHTALRKWTCDSYSFPQLLPLQLPFTVYLLLDSQNTDINPKGWEIIPKNEKNIPEKKFILKGERERSFWNIAVFFLTSYRTEFKARLWG